MKIALIGATGYTGSRILAEALARGHEVTALVRDAGKVPPNPRVTAQAVDVVNTHELAQRIANHDVVVSAFNPGKDPTGLGAASILQAAKTAQVKRLFVVGGAGSLEIASGQRLVDQPDFPAPWRDGALKTAAFLDALKAVGDLDWTFLSPAANLAPGQRTGVYRTGADRLLVDASGNSRISNEDLAVAALDELERPQHLRRRFTVAY